MPRTRLVIWRYECDFVLAVSCLNQLVLYRGQGCNTGRGTIIHDQADADAVARQDGWTVGRHVYCPNHAGGAA